MSSFLLATWFSKLFGGLPADSRLINVSHRSDGRVVTLERAGQMSGLLAVGEIGHRRKGARAVAPGANSLAFGAGAIHGDAVDGAEKFLLVGPEVARLVIQGPGDAGGATEWLRDRG